jgi:predicted HTH domain antitoxin
METSIKIPQDVFNAMKLPEKGKIDIILLELALTLYDRHILSFGKARELAKLSKNEFHLELGKRKIERHYNEENYIEDYNYGTD